MPNQKNSPNQNQNGNRGFASMDKEKQRDSARKGGEASQGNNQRHSDR
jgi:general stress protein YciG